MTDEKIFTTADIAKRLKLDPKRLRAIMRANGMHAPKTGRYEFHEKDVAKLSAAIRAHDESKQPAKK